MIVVDASVAIEVLLQTDDGIAIADRLLAVPMPNELVEVDSSVGRSAQRRSKRS